MLHAFSVDDAPSSFVQSVGREKRRSMRDVIDNIKQLRHAVFSRRAIEWLKLSRECSL
jgi:hypothetical protein